jgi:hypothetical protein
MIFHFALMDSQINGFASVKVKHLGARRLRIVPDPPLLSSACWGFKKHSRDNLREFWMDFADYQTVNFQTCWTCSPLFATLFCLYKPLLIKKKKFFFKRKLGYIKECGFTKERGFIKIRNFF